MIRPVAAVAGGAAVRRAGGAARGFAVPAGEAEGVASAAAAAAGPVGLAGLLALQEFPAERAEDRAARRHGEALLAELAALQRALLEGAPADLGRLAALARDVPEARDPVLRAAVAAVALRARIELARREAAG